MRPHFWPDADVTIVVDLVGFDLFPNMDVNFAIPMLAIVWEELRAMLDSLKFAMFDLKSFTNGLPLYMHLPHARSPQNSLCHTSH